jgi:hypothetical protein
VFFSLSSLLLLLLPAEEARRRMAQGLQVAQGAAPPAAVDHAASAYVHSFGKKIFY